MLDRFCYGFVTVIESINALLKLRYTEVSELTPCNSLVKSYTPCHVYDLEGIFTRLISFSNAIQLVSMKGNA